MTSFSAWDVAGAVVWTPLAVFLAFCGICYAITNGKPLDAGDVGAWASVLVIASFAIYCIARICGVRA